MVCVQMCGKFSTIKTAVNGVDSEERKHNLIRNIASVGSLKHILPIRIHVLFLNIVGSVIWDRNY